MVNYKVDPNDPLPRYYQVYVSLRQRIRDKEFQAGDALPSERRLVHDYGVSRITIVKALDMLEREGLIERQHGRGNFVAELLSGADGPNRRKIALFLPYVVAPFLPIIAGVLKGMTDQGVQLQIVGAYKPSEESWYVQDAIEHGVEGIIFFPSRGYPNEELYLGLLEKQFPFVMVDRYHPRIKTDHVVFNDFDSIYKLTESLIRKGHEHIAILTSHEVSVTSAYERLRGYQHALEDHGLTYNEHLVWLDVYKELDKTTASVAKLESAYQKLAYHINQYQPTALIAINKNVSEQLHHDLAVIHRAPVSDSMGADSGVTDGAYDIAIAAMSNERPPAGDDFLTVLALQSDELLGETAVRLLIKRINGDMADAPASIMLPLDILEMQ